MELALANMVTAAVASGVGGIQAQNMMVAMKLRPGDPWKIWRTLYSEGRLTTGIIPFSKRQVISGGFAYAGADRAANGLFGDLPYIPRIMAAGTLTGIGETVVTLPNETKELAAMVKRTVSRRLVAQGAGLRNIWGWMAAQAANEYVNKRQGSERPLSIAQITALGLVAGAVAAAISLPFQNMMTDAAGRGEESLWPAVKRASQAPRESFIGLSFRMVYMGVFTAAAAIATKMVSGSNPRTSIDNASTQRNGTETGLNR